MRATLMCGPGDVRVETVADPAIQESTDAVVRVVRARVCGSDLHPYHSMPAAGPGQPMGHGRNISLNGGPAPVRAYIEDLLPGILDRSVDPGKVFDRTVPLDEVPAAYRAMDAREVLKALIAF